MNNEASVSQRERESKREREKEEHLKAACTATIATAMTQIRDFAVVDEGEVGRILPSNTA